MIKKIIIALVVVFGVLQIFQIDKNNPPVIASEDFLTIQQTPENTAVLIKNACYDCHSNETKYPWYSNVQPIAWMLKDHIDEGRRELNFSTFGTYDIKRQMRKMEESAELIQNGEMPMSSYLITHPEAKLSENEKMQLINYFRGLSASLGGIEKP